VRSAIERWQPADLPRGGIVCRHRCTEGQDVVDAANSSGCEAAQASLFDAAVPDFLEWLPDEPLFSLCSRFHRLSLHGSPARTSRALFGHPRGGIAHDLPDRIDAFVQRTQGRLGTADSIVRAHTVLPFYLPLRPPDAAAAAVATLQGAGIGFLKFRLGLLTSRFRAHHPLKLCSRCMAEDLDAVHVAYWHLAHQYPGVWVCPKHRCLLLESTVKSTGVGRFHWHLPDECRPVLPTLPPHDGAGDEALLTLLQEIATASIALAALPKGFHFDPHQLTRTNAAQMIRSGFARPSGRVDRRGAAGSLAAFLAPLCRVPELATLAVHAEKAGGQLTLLRDPARALTHPLRVIALVLWLHGTWDRFMQAYRRPEAACEDAIGLALPTPQADPRRSDFLRLVQDQQASISRAARQVGIDVQTGMVWAARAGIASPRRPKDVSPLLRTRLVADLRRGLGKQEAADRHAVSVQTVTRTLRTEIGLQEAWACARLEQRRKQERRAWLRLARGKPLAGVKALRGLKPATYAWLYRNDRPWLQAQVDVLPSEVRGNHASVDWARRDADLCRSVERACAAIASETGSQRIARWQIYQRVPELKPKLQQLHRLPLTRAAIERAVRRRTATTPDGSLF
jgi:hypothetical protein